MVLVLLVLLVLKEELEAQVPLDLRVELEELARLVHKVKPEEQDLQVLRV